MSISGLFSLLTRSKKLLAMHGSSVQADCGKSSMRQYWEIAMLRFKRGFSPEEYYLLQLYKDEKREHMSVQEFKGIRNQLNQKFASSIPFNKFITGEYLSSLGIRMPRSWGVFQEQWGCDTNAEPLQTREQLLALIETLDNGFVMKPALGERGGDVFVIQSSPDSDGFVTRANGKRVRIDELIDSVSGPYGFIIQERIQQHECLKAVHPNSVNCVRFVTLRQSEQRPIALFACLKMGDGGAEVDNTAAINGLVCPIDLDNGVCGPARRLFHDEMIHEHPFSGQPITNLELPFWEETVQQCLKAHRALPHIGTIGWDVAIAKDGPVLIEANASWYHNFYQVLLNTSLWNSEFSRSLGNTNH